MHVQTIPMLPPDFKEYSKASAIKLSADGRQLFGSNRGHDSIAVYRIGDDGQLSRIAIEPSLGQGPQNLAITPDGNWLLCANMPGNNVAVFRIAAETGRLSSAGPPVALPKPSCIRVLAP